MSDITSTFPLPTNWLNTPEDQAMLRDSLQYFNDIDGGMTHYQITMFVLNNIEFPTHASKYYQARKEMFVRYTNLINGYQEVQLLQAEAKLLEAEIEEKWLEKETKVRNANIDIMTVKKEQKLMRIEFVKKEASRQLREMKAFWDNHQAYGQMLRPGVTQELAEPEHWMKKALRSITWVERMRAIFKGEEAAPMQLKRYLASTPIQQGITEKLLEPIKQKVIQGGK